MKGFLGFRKLDSYLRKRTAIARARYLADKRKRLKNKTPTILCNNCVGGMIYHDLGLQFCSPTINVLLKGDDFFKFAGNLSDYLACEMTQVFEDGITYPMGLLKRGDEEVRLHFMHAESFDEAKAQWVERASRVNMDNIYVIYEYSKKPRRSNHYYQAFKQLPYRHKRMLTMPILFSDPEVVPMTVYLHGYCSGKVLKYPGKYRVKRYLDRFDYVSFLNEE